MEHLAEKFRELAHIFNADFEYRKFVNLIKNKQYAEARNHNLIKILDEVVFGEDNKPLFSCTLPKGRILYRARVIKNDEISFKNGFKYDKTFGTHGFDEMNSREPPLFLSPAGRINITGQSFFYAAETEGTAIEEVRPTPNQIISLAKFELLRDLSIVDFATDQEFPIQLRNKYNMSPGHFFTAIMLSFSTPPEDEWDYQVTQYIGDHIRKTGFDGICYMSQFTRKKNYAIFNSHPKNLKYLGSEVVFKITQISHFLKLSDSEDFFSQDQSVMELSDDRKSHVWKSVTQQLGKVLRDNNQGRHGMSDNILITKNKQGADKIDR